MFIIHGLSEKKNYDIRNTTDIEIQSKIKIKIRYQYIGESSTAKYILNSKKNMNAII